MLAVVVLMTFAATAGYSQQGITLQPYPWDTGCVSFSWSWPLISFNDCGEAAIAAVEIAMMYYF